MPNCADCSHMRGKMRVLRGHIDFKSYECFCHRGLLLNEWKGGVDRVFRLGTRSNSKNFDRYLNWQKSSCTDFVSMDD